MRRVLEVFEPLEGGVPEHVLQLGLGLRARDWEVEVAAPAESPFAEHIADEGLIVHRLPLARRLGGGDLAAMRELRRLDRERGFAIVHAHSSKAGVLVRSVIPDSARIVYSPHCFAFNRALNPVVRAAAWAAEQALVPRTGAIVAVCEWERRQAARVFRGAERRTAVVENGVEPCGQPAPAEALARFADGQPLAGFIGRLEKQKDPVRLVRVFARAIERGAAGRLAIVGNGSLEEDVRAEIARAGIGDRAALFAFEPGRTEDYLAAFDLFVLPSRWESLPISLLEAMSCGVPVVATAVGGVGDLLAGGRAGRAVPADDDQALAGAIAELMADAEGRRRLGDHGRELVEARFRRERMVARTEALYLQLLEELGRA